MSRDLNRPAVDFERRPPNYPLMIIGGFIFLCLAAAMVLAANSAVWSILVIVLFASAGSVAYLYFNSVRRPAGLQHRLDWQAAISDVQKQSVALEVEEIANAIQLDPWQTSELFTAYIVAEDLALRQIQQEQNAPVIRHVQVGQTPFDALVINGNNLIAVEVSFLITPEVREEKIVSMLKKASTLKRFVAAEKLDATVKLLIVLVTQLAEEDVAQLRSALGKDRFADTAVDIDIRLLDFEELQRTYLTDN